MKVTTVATTEEVKKDKCDGKSEFIANKESLLNAVSMFTLSLNIYFSGQEEQALHRLPSLSVFDFSTKLCYHVSGR